MKIGRLEIIYLKTGLEGGHKDSKVVIGWAFRKYFLTAWIRIRPNFFRHLLFGYYWNIKKIMWGISK